MTDRKYHFWIVAKSEGKPYLIYGSPNSEEEARSKGLEMLGGMDFEIKRLPTRDLAKASSMVRGVRLEDTHSLKEASKRIGHNKSIKKLKRKKDAFSDLLW